ncbi:MULTISPECIES: acyl-CoA carboxylase epsilon subunit [unclassified Streptomyces]|uniref:acyl-CoA carboxylase epsilon subunit n=1 Tax=unclassified Streptomyces TaxID=2593676 RepID=UPI00382792F8
MSGPAAGHVQVVRGRPTPEELAAALVALRALAVARQSETESGHAVRRRPRLDALRRQPEQRGQGAWRRSAWR